jgi:hypothetical protein
MILRGMLDLCWVIFKTVVDLFRPRAALGAEMLVLRQQIVVLRRGKAGRLPFSAIDRMVLGWICRLCPTARHRSTRHRGAVASRRFAMLLAL